MQVVTEIKKLKINTNEILTIKDLTRMIKFNKYWFADKDENNALVQNLQKFKASIQQQIEAEHDTRGNKKSAFEVKVDSTMKMSFVLEMPVFIGQPNKKFKVDIAFDVRDGEIDVWLESPELEDLLKNEAVSIIDSEIKQMSDKGIVVIEY
jgi:hypothetical protein